ncbi:MAG: hypothetical protein V2B18_04030, partial [Pseudomonadota bacterium]
VVYSSPIAVNVYLETGTKVFLCGLTFLGLGSCRVSGQAEVLHSLRHIVFPVTLHLRSGNSNLNVAQAFQPANFLSAISAGRQACPTRVNGHDNQVLFVDTHTPVC